MAIVPVAKPELDVSAAFSASATEAATAELGASEAVTAELEAAA